MIDYMVMEAVYMKVLKEDDEAQKAAKRDAWKKAGKDELDKYR